MEVVVITSIKNSPGEISRVIALFEQGLPILHLRKPSFSSKDMELFIREIPVKFHERIVIHGHYHLAFKFGLKGIHFRHEDRASTFRNRMRHFLLRLRKPGLQFSTTFQSLESLAENKRHFHYVFLGPIFNSRASFELDRASAMKALQTLLRTCTEQVYAFGGVNESRISLLKEAGFDGVGLSGYVWKNIHELKYSDMISRLRAA